MCVWIGGVVLVCVRGEKSSFITSKLRTDSIICRNHMEITSHCSSWSTKFGSNHIGGIGGAIYLEGERASQALYAYMYVCMRVCEKKRTHLSFRGMSRGTRTPWEATRSLPIWDQRQREISLTLPYGKQPPT